MIIDSEVWRLSMSVAILGLFFLVRLYSLSISMKHERFLIAQGAVEHGARNSKYLAWVHILIYLLSFSYAVIYHPPFDRIAQAGTLLLIGSYIVLFWVIHKLGPIWTLKIYILKEHKVIKTGIFKYIKHPNYFLNIIPELIGVILLTHAYPAAILLLPYAYILFIRIKQEERAMSHLK